jgi:tRNA(Ile)-lysidine synthase
MANLKKQSPNKPLQKVSLHRKSTTQKHPLLTQLNTFFSTVFLEKNAVIPHLVVGFSGGLDSSVLLHLLANLRQTLPFQLSAHHVHHGLSQHADAWADLCEKTCIKLNIPLTISKVNVDINSGLGVEASARKLRYAVLLANDKNFICTAHHQDDQAETLLLQLARGAGVKGLSGMAAVDVTRKLLRPLLNISRAELESYAQQHQLSWVEDDSNSNTQFDRNFMRHTVLPTLMQHYPAIKNTLARTAQHLADAESLLDVLATQDAQACLTDLGKKTLALGPLRQLNLNRINNVLRWWLAQNNVLMPSAVQLRQITQQLLDAKTDATIKIHLKAEVDLTLRRYQDCAYLVPEIVGHPAVDAIWQGEAIYALPNQMQLTFKRELGAGLSLKHLDKQRLTIKTRVGGERIKPDLNRPSRSLKTVMQQAAIPPWQRSQLPLIFVGETLAMIPNFAVEASLKAAANEMGLVVSWQQL